MRQSDSSPLVKEAAAWCIVNLTWSSDPGAGGCFWLSSLNYFFLEDCDSRCAQLHSMGLAPRLQRMMVDPEPEVRSRGKTAYEQLMAGFERGSAPKS